MNDKLRWLRNKIKGEGLDGMIITNPINIKYLTGLEEEGIFLITRKENILLTDPRYIESVNKKLTIADEIIVDNFSTLIKEDFENYFVFCDKIGFEENHLTYAKYKYYKQLFKINDFVETDRIIEKQRMIKDEEELNNIKKACEITDKAFNYICGYIKPGITEKEIAKEIEKFMFENGANGLAFDTIVATGENSSMPHAIPTDRKVQEKDIVLMDFGCKYNDYCSDMTRTIFVGEPSREQKNVYDIVLKNQKNVINNIKEDENVRTLSLMVESDFKINNYTLDHALGHGVGIEVHEIPVVGKKDYLLKDRMIITDEPGIYIPGIFGIRIEDTILVNKDGCECLTKSDKNIIII